MRSHAMQDKGMAFFPGKSDQIWTDFFCREPRRFIVKWLIFSPTKNFLQQIFLRPHLLYKVTLQKKALYNSEIQS